MSVLADLLQDLAWRLPGDPLQPEQTDWEPLRQQALQSAAKVLEKKEEKKDILKRCKHMQMKKKKR